MTDALTLMQATPFAVVFVLAVVCVAIAIGALFD